MYIYIPTYTYIYTYIEGSDRVISGYIGVRV